MGISKLNNEGTIPKSKQSYNMAGGFIAFRCSNYDNTAEREQFRTLCKQLRRKYYKSEKMCFLIANYNMFDCEFDAILVKNDAIIAIEFKNYGGKIKAVENGEWTSNGTPIKGGSRKTVYQQARVNHASLRNGLKELGINSEWTKDLPSIIVFNKLITLENRLSNKVQSWLHVTDNAHFIEKIEDITCTSTDMSNTEMLDLAIKLNLNSFIDKDLSSIFTNDEEKSKEPEPISDVKTEVKKDSSVPVESKSVDSTENVADLSNLTEYDRFTPNHIFSLRPNQIFVFGTDKWGSQKYGAAGLTAKKFGAQIGIIEGATGFSYALPTKGFTIADLQSAVVRFKEYVDGNPQLTYLVTPVGCGHAGFRVDEVSALFRDFITYKNVMLPKVFIDEYTKKPEISFNKEESLSDQPEISTDESDTPIDKLIKYLRDKGIHFNESGPFAIKDEDGNVVAEAEIGIESEKRVFCPFNIQSANAFRYRGYTISDPQDYMSSNSKK